MNAALQTSLPGSRSRLDQHLVDIGLYASRSRAADAIKRGCVRVDGAVAGKAGQMVAVTADIETDDRALAYVSRAALKLKAGLEACGFSPEGNICLDLGASTGGFTQLLLEAGAAKVFAIDVGHGQMDTAIAADPRVVNLEGINARDLTLAMLAGEPPHFIVSDVSFISLKLALPPALAVAAPGAKGVFLVKPQFEAGRAAIGKGGLLRNPELADAIAADLAGWLDAQPGWRHTHLVPSPIEGGDGNREFLLIGEKSA